MLRYPGHAALAVWIMCPGCASHTAQSYTTGLRSSMTPTGPPTGPNHLTGVRSITEIPSPIVEAPPGFVTPLRLQLLLLLHSQQPRCWCSPSTTLLIPLGRTACSTPMHAVSSACEGGGAEKAAILCWRHVGPAGFIMPPPELLGGCGAIAIGAVDAAHRVL